MGLLISFLDHKIVGVGFTSTELGSPSTALVVTHARISRDKPFCGCTAVAAR